MGQYDLAPQAQQWLNTVLIWVGFGTVAGVLAKLIVPGNRPQGAIPTILIGLVGSVIGLQVLSLLAGKVWHAEIPNAISPLGLIAAVGASFLLVLGCRSGGILSELWELRKMQKKQKEAEP